MSMCEMSALLTTRVEQSHHKSPVNITHCILFSGLHPDNGGDLKMKKKMKTKHPSVLNQQVNIA